MYSIRVLNLSLSKHCCKSFSLCKTIEENNSLFQTKTMSIYKLNSWYFISLQTIRKLYYEKYKILQSDNPIWEDSDDEDPELLAYLEMDDRKRDWDYFGTSVT